MSVATTASRPRSAPGSVRDSIIGVSCYDDPHLARAARRAGADYIAFGAMFASGDQAAGAAGGHPSFRRMSPIWASHAARSAASRWRARRR
jgi:hypothetical protein